MQASFHFCLSRVLWSFGCSARCRKHVRGCKSLARSMAPAGGERRFEQQPAGSRQRTGVGMYRGRRGPSGLQDGCSRQCSGIPPLAMLPPSAEPGLGYWAVVFSESAVSRALPLTTPKIWKTRKWLWGRLFSESSDCEPGSSQLCDWPVAGREHLHTRHISERLPFLGTNLQKGYAQIPPPHSSDN